MMIARIRSAALIVPALLALASPVRAEVIAQDSPGFVSRNAVVVAGTPAAVWNRLVAPAEWWSSVHTFSGDAANLTLDPVPGGCFCERLPADEEAPAKPGAPRAPARGGVEHMRVVFVDHAKALRLVGALGPLQSEAVNATLTITLKPVEGGTRVIFEYIVGGYMRYPADKIAHAVDGVMAEQLLSLAKLFGAVVAVPQVPTPAPSAAPPPAIKGGLGKDGLLLPRGKVWSLPQGETAAPPPAPLPDAPAVAPLPSLPVPPDSSVASSTPAPAPAESPPPARITVVPVEESKIAPEPAPAPAAAPAPALDPAPAPAPKKPARAKAKVPPKPAKPAEPADDQPSRSSIDSALDAAFPSPPTH